MVLKTDATDLAERVGSPDGRPERAAPPDGKPASARSPKPKHQPHAAAPMVETAVAPDSPDRFINRELSWLDFNHRVLDEAENPRHPLLERLRFLSISASNLDEFYSVRVAALIGQAKAGRTLVSADGRTAAQQLTAIKQRAELLQADQQRILAALLDLLRDAGVELCGTDSLSDDDKTWLDAAFMERI